jgi:DNA polymerase-3 subunit epsilon
MAFVAIDFETADYRPDSACAVGLARVEDGQFVERAYYLIRPPRRQFVFTHIHGLTWDDVRHEPTFRDLWPVLEPMFHRAAFLVAHNAAFDRRVLRACCATAGVAPPAAPFRCTMVLARQLWRISPTRLPDVCNSLGISLDHHHAASDTEACARIMIEAMKHPKYKSMHSPAAL